MCFQWKTRLCGRTIFTLSGNFFASPRDHLGPLLLLEDSEVILGQEILDDAVKASGGQTRLKRKRRGRGGCKALQRRGRCVSVSLCEAGLSCQSWWWWQSWHRDHWVEVSCVLKRSWTILLWLSSWSFGEHSLKNGAHWLPLFWVSIKLAPEVCGFYLQWQSRGVWRQWSDGGVCSCRRSSWRCWWECRGGIGVCPLSCHDDAQMFLIFIYWCFPVRVLRVTDQCFSGAGCPPLRPTGTLTPTPDTRC